jgi:hypothetical protein
MASQTENRRLYRAFLLREELRLLYHLDDPRLAPAHLDAWASRSRLRPFVRLARTLRAYRDGILAAIRLGLSNSRLEGLNSKIRLISHRSFGFHSADALIALVYLCCTRHHHRATAMNFTHNSTGAPRWTRMTASFARATARASWVRAILGRRRRQ